MPDTEKRLRTYVARTALMLGGYAVLSCGGGTDPDLEPAIISLDISPPLAQLFVGQSLTLVADAKPAGRTVTYTFSNSTPAVVAVNSSSTPGTATITAVAQGNTLITVTAQGSASGYKPVELSRNVTIAVVAGAPLGMGFANEQFSAPLSGTFDRGSNNGAADEQPVRSVTLSQPFQMQRTEVTQGQWRSIIGSNPSTFGACGDLCPVENVSWDDIQVFLQALNSRGLGTFRLPTEAEWEFACRAGTTGDYHGQLDAVAWRATNSGAVTHPVATREPNGLGLHDMHGNVFEWVQDWYASNYYANSPTLNPAGPGTGSLRVARGGSWSNVSAQNLRSAYREPNQPSTRVSNYGFRLVKVP